jgi:hypothetical protein
VLIDFIERHARSKAFAKYFPYNSSLFVLRTVIRRDR